MIRLARVRMDYYDRYNQPQTYTAILESITEKDAVLLLKLKASNYAEIYGPSYHFEEWVPCLECKRQFWLRFTTTTVAVGLLLLIVARYI